MSTEASPVSLRISRLGAVTLPSWMSSEPGAVLSNRRIFGSHRIFTGTAARSVTFSACNPKIIVPLNCACTAAGAKEIRAGPPAAGGAEGAAGAGAVLGIPGGGAAALGVGAVEPAGVGAGELGAG